MQFETRYRSAIAEGSIDLTFRRWKRPQVVAGNTYRTAAGRVVVDGVDVVDPRSITDEEARRAGYASAAALVAGLRGGTSLPVYRVAFRPATGADPRDELAADTSLTGAQMADIEVRLARLDRASPSGPWTRSTLNLIAANPAVRAGDLAPQLGQEVLAFKLNVRKLKNLGLTLSLESGYRLSSRGGAWLGRDVP
ncbi:MAG: hypothetical protein IPO51_12400 [Dehalococcoidia bacterium]|nr:hypothetical protein [Dehalococcoidia bacterium]